MEQIGSSLRIYRWESWSDVHEISTLADFAVPLLAAGSARANPLSHRLDSDDPISIDRNYGRWSVGIGERNNHVAGENFARAVARASRLRISLRTAAHGRPSRPSA